jgi:hypothetical protein
MGVGITMNTSMGMTTMHTTIMAMAHRMRSTHMCMDHTVTTTTTTATHMGMTSPKLDASVFHICPIPLLKHA